MNQSESEHFVEITKRSTMVGFRYWAFKDLGMRMPEVFMLANQITTKENEDTVTIAVGGIVLAA